MGEGAHDDTVMTARYRSKLELFQEMLEATRHASRKTRIIGLANLNPRTFQKYMDFASSHGLTVEKNGTYRLTDRADRALAVLRQVAVKSTELDATILQLKRGTWLGRIDGWTEGDALRQISRIAWSGAPSSYRESCLLPSQSNASAVPYGNKAPSEKSLVRRSGARKDAVLRRGKGPGRGGSPNRGVRRS